MTPISGLDKPHVDHATIKELFHRFSHYSAELVGSPAAFLAGVVLVAIWAATGHYFHYSDTWQLVINTGTTIITFLIVFLIQNTQTRDTRAIQLKLDELLRSVKAARNELVRLEDLSDTDLEKLREEFGKVADRGDQKSQLSGDK